MPFTHPDVRPALVLGASAGIGAATAEALARAGHPVVLAARRQEACEALAERIRVDGGQAVALAADATDADAVAALVDRAEDALGAIEVAVLTVGAVTPGLVRTSPPGRLAAQVTANLLPAQHLISAVAPRMVARGRGDVLFASSDTVVSPRPRLGAYTAAKAGLEGLVRTLQMELEHTGVRATLVRIGQTAGTDMGRDWDEDETVAVLEDWVRWGHARHPRMLRPADVAHVLALLVGLPRGTTVPLLEVQPEADVQEVSR